MFSFKPAFLALSCAALSALAAPFTSQLDKRIVVDPKITNPTASTVWTVGQTVEVTWCVSIRLVLILYRDTHNMPHRDTSAIPSGQTVFGMLVLGFLTDDSENLDIGELLFPYTLSPPCTLRHDRAPIFCSYKSHLPHHLLSFFSSSLGPPRCDRS